MAIIIDVETTGIPKRGGLPYGYNPAFEKLHMYDTARVVQISMMLCNDKFEQIEMVDFIVKADGFAIKNSAFHGITDEKSATEGIPFPVIAQQLSTYLTQVSHVIAHNANFDLCIIKSELYRAGLHEIIEELNKKQVLCTMKHMKPMVNIRTNNGIKDPSLAELYRYVVGTDISNAHNAKYDVINLHAIIKILYDTHRLNYDVPIVYTHCYPLLTLNNHPFPVNEPPAQLEVGYSKLKLAELRKYCKENGVIGYHRMNKAALIYALNK